MIFSIVIREEGLNGREKRRELLKDIYFNE